MHRHKIVLITVTYNSSNFIEGFLESIVNSSMTPYKLIIIDNNSLDNTVDIIRKFISDYNETIDIEIIQNTENLGYAPAIAKAIESIEMEARDTLLLICNCDGYFDPNCIERLYNFYVDKARRPLAVQPLILRPDGRIDSYGNLFNKFGLACPDILGPKYGLRHFYISGACYLIPLSLYRLVGGLDKNIFLGADDLDISWRIRLMNMDIAVCGDAYYYHFGASKQRILSPVRYYWSVWSIFYAMMKSLSPYNLVRLLPFSFFLNLLISLLLTLYNVSIEYVHSYLRAVMKLFCSLPVISDNRAITQGIRRIDDDEVFKSCESLANAVRISLQRYLGIETV